MFQARSSEMSDSHSCHHEGTRCQEEYFWLIGLGRTDGRDASLSSALNPALDMARWWIFEGVNTEFKIKCSRAIYEAMSSTVEEHLHW